jgi:ATP-dependent 26S proteasome regulatory subunit
MEKKKKKRKQKKKKKEKKMEKKKKKKEKKKKKMEKKKKKRKQKKKKKQQQKRRRKNDRYCMGQKCYCSLCSQVVNTTGITENPVKAKILSHLYILRGFKTSDDAFRLSYSIAFDCSILPFLDLFHSWLYIFHLPGSPGTASFFSFLQVSGES